MQSNRSTPEKFWSRVFILGEHDCWEFLGGKKGNGYGGVSYEGKPWCAHRLSWTLTRGPIPTGMKVLHKCDTPACVNPSHLWVDTQAANVRDMTIKGRRKDQIGAQNGRSKLTEAQVLEIRALCNEGILTIARIGERYGVTDVSVSYISLGRTWKHLPCVEAQVVHKKRRGIITRGGINGMSKLTDEKVLLIRSMYAAGGVTQTQIGDRFGVSSRTVSLVVRGASWKHLPLSNPTSVSEVPEPGP